MPIDFAREFVEEALVAAARRADSELRETFREEKEAVDGIEIIDIREERLDALDSHWMERFHITQRFEDVLAAYPGVEDAVAECVVKLAPSPDEERAFLYASDPRPKPVLVVQLTAETLLELDRLQALVSSPLTHASRHRSS